MNSSSGIKRFNWVRARSAWEQNKAWRERRQAAREQFEANMAIANTAFLNAQTNQIAGLAELAAKAAASRIVNAIQTKIDKRI